MKSDPTKIVGKYILLNYLNKLIQGLTLHLIYCMERYAVHLAHLSETKVEIWCDSDLWPKLQEFFAIGAPPETISRETRIRHNRLRHIFDVILRRLTTKDILEKECVDQKNCAWVIKMFQGSQNTRIICCRQKVGQRDCLILSELIEKKKSQALDSNAKQIIARVAKLQYQLPPIIP